MVLQLRRTREIDIDLKRTRIVGNVCSGAAPKRMGPAPPLQAVIAAFALEDVDATIAAEHVAEAEVGVPGDILDAAHNESRAEQGGSGLQLKVDQIEQV